MKKKIGEVTHYFNRIGVAVIKLSKSIKVGDKIRITGHTTDFDQVVTSMEINHNKVEETKPGDDFALKVRTRVRGGDSVYKVK